MQIPFHANARILANKFATHHFLSDTFGNPNRKCRGDLNDFVFERLPITFHPQSVNIKTIAIAITPKFKHTFKHVMINVFQLTKIDLWLHFTK